MNSANKALAFLFVVILSVSCLGFVESVSGSLKPVVTDFWLEYVDASYDVAPSVESTKDLYTGEVTTSTVPGYRVENKSIVVTIKNPPDVDAYNFRWKDHNSEVWYYSPFDPEDPLPFFVPDSFGIDARASTSEYTVLSLLFISETHTWVDIQVQALYGNYRAEPYVHIVFPFDCPTYDFYFDGQASYWSKTQTLNLANDASTATSTATPTPPTPTPTATAQPTETPTPTPNPMHSDIQNEAVFWLNWERLALIALFLVVVVLAAILVLSYWRKT